MKYVIEIEEYDLKGRNMYLRDSYDKEGLFIVNDGMAFVLISVPNDTPPFSIPLPNKDIIKQLNAEYLNKKMAGVADTERDFKSEINNKLNMLIDLVEREPKKEIVKEPSGNNINLKDIIQIIIESQNRPSKGK